MLVSLGKAAQFPSTRFYASFEVLVAAKSRSTPSEKELLRFVEGRNASRASFSSLLNADEDDSFIARLKSMHELRSNISSLQERNRWIVGLYINIGSESDGELVDAASLGEFYLAIASVCKLSALSVFLFDNAKYEELTLREITTSFDFLDMKKVSVLCFCFLTFFLSFFVCLFVF